MAEFVYKDAKVWMDQFDISGFLNSVTVNHGIEPGDNTAMGDNVRSAMPGLDTLSFEHSAFVEFGDNLIEQIVQNRMGPNVDSGLLTIDVVAAAKTFTRTDATGSFIKDGFRVGQNVTTSGFTNGGNNGVKKILTVTDLVITMTVTTGLVNESGGGNEQIVRTEATEVPMTIGPQTGLEGERAVFFEAVNVSTKFGGAVGTAPAPMTFSGQASGSKQIVHGTIMEDGAVARTVTGAQSPDLQLGAVTAAQKLYGIFHLLAFSGWVSIDIELESSATGAFAGEETPRLSFTNATAIGAEYATPVSGAITDTWWRATWTFNGAGPGSATFVVAMGIR